MQQDPLLTSTTSVLHIRPKQLMEPEYHEYLKHDQYREQMMHEHTMHVEQNDLKKTNK